MDVSRLDGEMGLFWQGHTHPCVRMFSVTQDIIGVAYGMWFVELGFFLCCTCNYFLTIDQLIFVTLRWQSASSLLAVQYMAGDGKNDTTTRRQTVRRRRRGGVEAANERTIQLSMQYIHSGTQQQCTMLVIVHSNSSSTQCQGRKKSNYNHQLCIMFTPTIATTIHTMAAAAAAALQTPSPPRHAAPRCRIPPQLSTEKMGHHWKNSTLAELVFHCLKQIRKPSKVRHTHTHILA